MVEDVVKDSVEGAVKDALNARNVRPKQEIEQAMMTLHRRRVHESHYE